MPERIETPPTLAGNEQAQLQQIWAYLYSLSQAINNNLEGIGSNELTDAERTSMQAIIGKTSAEQGLSEMDTLKSLIIKTANFVQNSLMEYRLNLIGDTVASGTFGRYVRHTGLDVAVTPTGITQNYTFEEVVQGLKEFSINAKNYIKTGLLRTVNNIPVYGVAIGKDVVTFSQDGTETYNDGNKVAELTADELSFWQNNIKIASYTGTGITFYYGSSKRIEIGSNGVTFWNGTTKLAEMLSSGLKFYHNGTLRTQTDSTGMSFWNGTTKLAELLSSALKFYHNGALRTQTDSTGMSFWNGTTKLAELLSSGLSFYHNGTLRTQTDSTGMSFWNGTTKLAELLSSALKFYHNGALRTQTDSTGMSFWNGSTKLAELLSGELGFYQGGNKVMSLTGTKLAFLIAAAEVFAIEAGKLSCKQDLEIASGKAVKINKWTFDQNGLIYTDGNNEFEIKNGLYYSTKARGGIYFGTTQNGGKTAMLARKADGSAYARLTVESTNTDIVNIYAEGTRFANLGTESRPFVGSFLQDVIGRETTDQLTRSLSIVLSQNPDPNNVLSLYPMLEIYSNHSDGHVHMRTIGQWIIFDNTIDCGEVKYTTLTQKSSQDVKHDIREMEDVGEKIDALRPVTFIYDDDEDERRRAGLIYEEAEPVMPEICTGNEADKGISYMELVPMLLKEIQSLRARVSELERRMENVHSD